MNERRVDGATAHWGGRGVGPEEAGCGGRCSRPVSPRQVPRRRLWVGGSFAHGRRKRQPRLGMTDRTGGGGLRGPLIFGVIAATIELAIILWVMYC